MKLRPVIAAGSFIVCLAVVFTVASKLGALYAAYVILGEMAAIVWSAATD